MDDCTLLSLCSNYVAHNLHLLRSDRTLPKEVCIAVLSCVKEHELLDDEALVWLRHDFCDPRDLITFDVDMASDLHALNSMADCNALARTSFRNVNKPTRTRCSIKHFNFSRCDITTKGLTEVSTHPIESLDLSSCKFIEPVFFDCASIFSTTLTSLSLAHCTNIEVGAFSGLELLRNLKKLDLRGTNITDPTWENQESGLRSIPPGLEDLCLMGCGLLSVVKLHRSLGHLNCLQVLDISETDIEYECAEGAWQSFFDHHSHLHSVDVSACEQMATIDDEHKRHQRLAFFDALCSNQRLRWVNVSCNHVDGECVKLLMGLPQLKFVGLFDSNVIVGEISQHRPDVEVATNFTKEQLSLSLRHLCCRSGKVVREMLKCLYERLEGHAQAHERITEDNGLTELVISALEHFEASSPIQIVTTATLYYLTTDLVKHQSPTTRLCALRVLLTLLRQLAKVATVAVVMVVKNCCLTIRNFCNETELPRYSCGVAIALLQAALSFDDRTIQTTSLLICCYHLASLHPAHKQCIGKAQPVGGIELVLRLARRFYNTLHEESHDQLFQILELCWSFLWNITDETPINVRRFIDNDGLPLLLSILEKFPKKVALRRNAMGLVTNIAEVHECRGYLMTEAMLSEIKHCLDEEEEDNDGDDNNNNNNNNNSNNNNNDNVNNSLEITYNSTGTLCHLMAEGVVSWKEHGLSEQLREDLLTKIADVVLGWHTVTEKWINYRSLKPIISLLREGLEPQVHLWATWALLSLCVVNPGKYCNMCFREGALEALRVLETTDTLVQIRQHCLETIEICFSHAATNNDKENGFGDVLAMEV